ATPRPPDRLALKAETVRALKEGMRRAVHEPGGTANKEEFGLRDYRVALKTGTAELRKPTGPDAPANCAWIAGSAPPDQPRVAFVICLERVAYHGAEGAPVLQKVLEFLESEEPGVYKLPQRAGSRANRSTAGALASPGSSPPEPVPLPVPDRQERSP